MTDYNFYEPFFNNPASEAFIYPLEEYVKTRTSGTSSAEKWFMIPKRAFPKAFCKAGLSTLLKHLS